jgi:hypothetical protein
LERQREGEESSADDYEEYEADENGAPRSTITLFALGRRALGSNGHVVVRLGNDLSVLDLWSGSDADCANRDLGFLRGARPGSIVEPERLSGVGADRLAIRADESLREDGRRKRVEVVFLERL